MSFPEGLAILRNCIRKWINIKFLLIQNNPSQETANKSWFLQLLSIRVCVSTTA